MLLPLISLLLLVTLPGCAAAPRERDLARSPDTTAAEYPFHRDLSALDYSALTFTPLSIDTHLPPQPTRPYTVLVYMNGSDLESEGGAATADIVEMLQSGVPSDYVNLILFTGGANRWQNEVIPAWECAVWQIADGTLSQVAAVGQRNMGDPGTLAGFLAFGMETFPAERYGLILWDHGGGSIAGYGHDENFNNSALTLLEMNYAFEAANLSQNKLAFLGFDACLMSTAEMAVVAAEYAHVLIASEDLEPGDGWDYAALALLGTSPAPDGAAVGRAIVDYYVNFYGPFTRESVTLSVIDLSAAHGVMGAMGALMEACGNRLSTEGPPSFLTLAERRGNTKTFGGGSPRDNDCDMVDLGDMARKLSDLFPAEAEALLSALERAVLYHRDNADIPLSGLSGYYIFGGSEYAAYSLETYASLCMSAAYTDYLRAFAGALTDLSVPAQVPSIWASIAGRTVRLYEADRTDTGVQYAVPVLLNGREAELIVFFDHSASGTLLGARHEEGYIIQKGLDPVGAGGTLAFLRPRSDGSWEADAPLLLDSTPFVEGISAP